MKTTALAVAVAVAVAGCAAEGSGPVVRDDGLGAAVYIDCPGAEPIDHATGPVVCRWACGASATIGMDRGPVWHVQTSASEACRVACRVGGDTVACEAL